MIVPAAQCVFQTTFTHRLGLAHFKLHEIMPSLAGAGKSETNGRLQVL
jgi:hypothetical protein